MNVDIEGKLNEFIKSLGCGVVSPERVVSGLMEMQRYSKLFEQNKLFKE